MSNKDVAREVEAIGSASVVKQHYRTTHNTTKKVIFKSDKPSAVQENEYDAKSPQDVLRMYQVGRDNSVMFPNIPVDKQQYQGDFSEFGDMTVAMNQVAHFKSVFEGLPSEIRAKYDNDLSVFAKGLVSSNFKITDLMTEEYRKEYYEPELKRRSREKAYQDYLNKKKEEEMLEASK